MRRVAAVLAALIGQDSKQWEAATQIARVFALNLAVGLF